MGYLECNDLRVTLPGGWTLFDGVSFRVPGGQHAALVGPNGVGKTTLLKAIAGVMPPNEGTIHVDGRLGFMRQFVVAADDPTTVRAFLLTFAERDLQEAAARITSAEAALSSGGDAAQIEYAEALNAWGERGGYDLEVLWDTCAVSAVGLEFADIADRRIATFSGGEQKKLVLEVLFRSSMDVLLLDEPDNFLDIEGKDWLEDLIVTSPKTVLFVSHDRMLLAGCATRVVTLEGHGAWVHPEGYATYADAREARLERLDEAHRRYNEEHQRLISVMKEMKRKAAYNDGWARKARSMEKRVTRHEGEEPEERAAAQNVRMDIAGGRTGKVVFRAEGLELIGLLQPFDTEIWFGERVGVVGPNGSGKTHFLRLLAGQDVAHSGEWKLGARVVPGMFAQLHHRPELARSPIVEILRSRGFALNEAMSTLKRYELQQASQNPYEILSGGQQARLQLLLMEIDSPTMLLLDEPTDNLDLHSAEALEDALMRYQGTVLAVTHDRWFMRMMDRFLCFEEDGTVRELLESPYG